MPNIIEGLSATDVATDICNLIDGHIIKDYFDDGSEVGYDATTGDRTDKILVTAEDKDGNQQKFIVSVRKVL